MPSTPAGIIFDMDDTLVATSSLWRAAEEALLRAVGYAWTPELASQYKGMNAYNVAATIHRILQPSLALAECHRVMREALLEQFERCALRPMPGAVECVRRCQQVAPLALASGSPMPAIERALGALGIRGAFAVVISSEQVSRGKPAPDVFLAAAKLLEVPAERCLVFEDSLIGAQAAQAAGMACFVVPSIPNDQIAAACTRVYPSLDDVTLDDIRSAVAPRSTSSC